MHNNCQTYCTELWKAGSFTVQRINSHAAHSGTVNTRLIRNSGDSNTKIMNSSHRGIRWCLNLLKGAGGFSRSLAKFSS